MNLVHIVVLNIFQINDFSGFIDPSPSAEADYLFWMNNGVRLKRENHNVKIPRSITRGATLTLNPQT